MNRKKNFILVGLIYLILFAAYNMIIFMIFNKTTAVFWVSYAFMLITYFGHVACFYFITRNMTIRTVFFGIPLFSFSVYFVLAELFCSFVFMIFQSIVNIKVAVLIQTLLLFVFIIIAIISIMTRDAVQGVDDKIRKNKNFINGINIDIEMLIERSKLAEVTAELKKLSETIKYSDPMTNTTVEIQEQMIMQTMIELKTAFDNNDMNLVKELCNKINLLFIERNKKLMISK